MTGRLVMDFEDAVQEALLDALPRYEAGESLGFVRRAIKLSVLQYRRRLIGQTGRTKHTSHLPGNLLELSSQSLSRREIADARDDYSGVLSELWVEDTLSLVPAEEDRDMLRLLADGRTLEEVAARYRVKTGLVDHRRERAVKTIRTRLLEETHR